MKITINIDGKLGTPENSYISVLDRGFLYGDSVYEVLRTYNGRFFALDRHLDRLSQSAERLGIELPEREWLIDRMNETIVASKNEESYCRLIVTRGAGPLTLDPTTAHESKTIVIVKPYEPFAKESYEKGIRLWIPHIRRTSVVSLDPAIKSGNYLNSVLALKEARAQGFDDALMLDFYGNVTEATSSNVFIAKGKLISTPAQEVGLLPGVTRGLLLELLSSRGYSCRECKISLNDVETADEVMLTSTLREVQPVTMVGNKKVGNGKPGPISRTLRNLFHEYAVSTLT